MTTDNPIERETFTIDEYQVIRGWLTSKLDEREGGYSQRSTAVVADQLLDLRVLKLDVILDIAMDELTRKLAEREQRAARKRQGKDEKK